MTAARRARAALTMADLSRNQWGRATPLIVDILGELLKLSGNLLSLGIQSADLHPPLHLAARVLCELP